MKISKMNPYKLKEHEMHEKVTRVKIFLLNENTNEFIIAIANGGCQLPGGHVEENEPLKEAIKREIAEETGIILNKSHINRPFYEIRHYTKNYKNMGKNRISNVLYYFIKTNSDPNLNALQLTESEKRHNFTLASVKLENFEAFVQDFMNKTDIDRNKIIQKEMLLAFDELKKIM